MLKGISPRGDTQAEESFLGVGVGAGDANAAIGDLTSVFRIGCDLAEFGVEAHRRLGPIDAAMNLGSHQLERLREEELGGFFPSAVEIRCGL